MNLTAVPAGPSLYLVDCDQCGPLGTTPTATLHDYAHAHLRAHGIDPPMTTITCACGYDYTQVTGKLDDHAACNECDWEAYGMFADHQGVHHWLDTKHPWHLDLGT